MRLLTKIKSSLIILLVLVFNENHAVSDDLHIRNIGVDDGLSYYHVTDIIQDSKGYVWVSTLNGINRLDGNTILNYYEQPNNEGSLKNDRVISLCEGPYGNIWAGTGFGGIQILDVKKNTFINILLDEKNVLNNVVHSIIKLSNGDIICGTRGGELYRFSAKAIKAMLEGEKIEFKKLNLFSSQDEFSIDRIIDILEGPNEIWLIDWNKKLFRIDYSNKTTQDYHVNMINKKGINVSSIVKNNNDIFIGTSMGVYLLEENQKQRLKFDLWRSISNTKKLNVTGIALDNKNSLWVSGFKNEIYKIKDIYNENSESEYYSLNLNTPIRVKMIDESNVLWFSSLKSGVFNAELSFKNFNKYRYLNDMFDENNRDVSTSFLDSNNYLWTGLGESELLIYDTDKKHLVYTNNRIDPTSVFEDRLGFIWVTTREGVFCIKKTKDYLNPISTNNKIDFSIWGKNDFTNKLFNSVEEDVFGNVWLASDRELLYIIRNTKGEIREVKVIMRENESQISPCDIQTIKAFPGKSELWILQRGCGLTVMNYSQFLETVVFERFSAENKDDNYISSNVVNNIYFNTDAIWLSTDNGLNKLVYSNAGKKFVFDQFYNVDKGLVNSLTKSLEKDNQGNIWIGTNKGLAFFNIETNAFRVFTTKDGLSSNIFTNTSFKNKEGALVFGTVNGYVSFLPEEVELNKALPVAGFTSLSVFNKLIEPGELVNGSVILKKAISETDEIVINYKQNDFTIGFSAFHYAIPEKNKFEYLLEGYHNQWVSTNVNMPFASFANLSTGNYTLKLRASNNDGIWMDNVKALKIKVLPPPWKTVWAFLLYALVFGGVIYFIMKAWGSRIRLRNEVILERSKREKEKELNEMKLRYFTDISHEFRTPLTLIHGPVLELIEIFRKNKEVYSILLPLNLNINRMLRLLNQLLDFRKAETNNLKLHLTKGDIISLLENIINSYFEAAKSKSVNLKLKSKHKEFITWFDEDKLEKIIHNLLSNALKYTGQSGTIIVNFTSEGDNKVIISVKDTGKGISEKNKKKIFDRFFQEGIQSGTGIGLALVKKLVEIHQGEIEVESEIDEGSNFIIRIPVGENHFFDQIQNQVAKVGLDKVPVWIGGQYEEEIFEESAAQNEDVPLILVVEDDEDIRKYLERLLSSEFRVIIAEDGKKGEESAKKFLPDMIISDILMPEQDGIEMCRNLKSDINTTYIPIIFLTAKSSDKDKIEGLNIGATDYILKPFDPKELKIKVENILNDLKKNQDRLKRDFILNPSEVSIESPEEVFLQRAVQIVEGNMNDGNFNLLFFCNELGMSRMQLHRKLKKFTGQSTTEFIRSIRLKRAAQLLEVGHLSALEVMYEVGIESSSYFSKAFKKQYGATPHEYSIKKRPST
ncbi:ATP-binding protein [Tamlana sp. 2201CG12-4]|uniref:ATP-binding protein n=1 Tax=Tamlana sp. 2201CG12-4 TaxID=3112582 RepID=UPI002DB762B2|nr:ATP-binding protein [Tamlana sp. 2201CG12-4]MEC3908648.1 ATP-binding protein [Tamlana sp. 2201CG12-4]